MGFSKTGRNQRENGRNPTRIPITIALEPESAPEPDLTNVFHVQSFIDSLDGSLRNAADQISVRKIAYPPHNHELDRSVSLVRLAVDC